METLITISRNMQASCKVAGGWNSRPSASLGLARSLSPTDELVLEATGNTAAIVRSLRAYVSKVMIANPLQVRAIAHARVKTDKIDAGILAQLHASGFLPTVWMPDADTEALRRQVARRTQLVRHRTRLKNEMHSVLHAHLIPRCPCADLFGKKGRAWLEQQRLPADELCGLEQRMREFDRHGEDLAVIDRALAQATLEHPRVRRLLTISGVNVTVAISLIAAIGDIGRFRSAQKLVSYFGLNPSVSFWSSCSALASRNNASSRKLSSISCCNSSLDSVLSSA